MEKIYDRNKINEYLNTRAYRNYFSEEFDEEAYLIRSSPNETLIEQGEEATNLYYLMEGRLRVKTINQEGKSFVLNTIIAPSLVGEIELISEDVSFSVETIGRCVLIALPLVSCRDRLLNDRRFLLRLCELLTEKEREHALKLVQYTSYPLENRLSAFILENALNGRLSLRKTVIAESLGVSYRHLETVMKEFTKKGILRKDRFVYVILNKEELMEKTKVLDIF
ncbi:MAG: cyclic nucleotide-binding domain-containing protein [Erysipelotrichaceae bacterium]|nr:cyclic nucleotide-binding domain-containing protein [Erysipelotrichaceae bacterium]